MVSETKVMNDLASLASLFSKYNSIFNSLSSSWRGDSFDKLLKSAQEFSDEYYGSLKKQLEAFGAACDLYARYDVAKRNKEIATNNYNQAVSRGDSSRINEFSSQISTFEAKANDYKKQIESYLLTASKYKLDATNYYGSEAVTPPVKPTTPKTSAPTSPRTSAPTYYSGSNVGDLDMTNYPKGRTRKDGLQRSVLVAKYLMKYGGFTAIQAAAMAGVYLDENNCTPGDVMEAERAGRGARGTGGNGYGAGIASWTFVDFKNQCLKDAGFPANTPIESLTFKQQCDMIIAMSQKSCKKYYNALKRCTTVEDASATAVIITGGVGYSKNWNTHPTPAEAAHMAEVYGRSNDRRFGYSPHHWGGHIRRLNNAKEILQYLK